MLKKLIKLIKILKKSINLVWFRFFKPGTKKTEPKKPEKNRVKPSQK